METKFILERNGFAHNGCLDRDACWTSRDCDAHIFDSKGSAEQYAMIYGGRVVTVLTKKNEIGMPEIVEKVGA